MVRGRLKRPHQAPSGAATAELGRVLAPTDMPPQLRLPRRKPRRTLERRTCEDREPGSRRQTRRPAVVPSGSRLLAARRDDSCSPAPTGGDPMLLSAGAMETSPRCPPRRRRRRRRHRRFAPSRRRWPPADLQQELLPAAGHGLPGRLVLALEQDSARNSKPRQAASPPAWTGAGRRLVLAPLPLRWRSRAGGVPERAPRTRKQDHRRTPPLCCWRRGLKGGRDLASHALPPSKGLRSQGAENSAVCLRCP